MVHSDDDRPETVTVDGRSWTADITCSEDRLVLDVAGKMTSAPGFIVAMFLCETTDQSALKEDRIQAHLKRQPEQTVRYMPA